MTTLEVTLSISIAAVIIAAFFICWHYHQAWYDMIYIFKRDRDTLNKITQEGVFDAILDVNKFNEWFKNNKDKDIYAHAGIYLRLDKLSEGHIKNYIRVTTKGMADIDHFKWETIRDFEHAIRDSWQKQLREK
jgi:hypothetical protein